MIKNRILYFILLAIICISTIVLNIININTEPRAIVYDFVSVMLLRGFAYLSMGLLLGHIVQKASQIIDSKYFSFSTAPMFLKIFYSVVELFTYGYLFMYFFTTNFNVFPWGYLLAVASFVLLFIISIKGMGFLSYSIFNKKIFGFLGDCSYSIYIMQSFVFWLIYVYAPFIHLSGAGLILFWMVVFIIVGVLGYVLIEKPFNKLCDIYKKHRGKI